MSLHRYTPHPHLAHRRKHGAPTVAGAVAEHPSFNMRLAAWGTSKFGTMPMFYACVIYGALGAIFTAYQATLLYWSNWVQLWSLPLIMVGGIVLGLVANKMAKQQFDDVEALLHGQSEQAAHLAAQDDKILAILAKLEANTALTEDVRAAIANAAAVPQQLVDDVKRAPKAKPGGDRM